MEVTLADGKPAHLGGGKLLAAISTSIVAILREHYGRGPMKAKTYALDDIIVVVMRGSGFTSLEQTIMDSGEPDRVVAMRQDFQRVMAERYTRDDRGAHRSQGRRVPLPSPRRARHHDGDLLRRRPARRLRRGRDHRSRSAPRLSPPRPLPQPELRISPPPLSCQRGAGGSRAGKTPRLLYVACTGRVPAAVPEPLGAPAPQRRRSLRRRAQRVGP